MYICIYLPQCDNLTNKLIKFNSVISSKFIMADPGGPAVYDVDGGKHCVNVSDL